MTSQEHGVAIRATHDFDRNITDSFPARPDLIEIRPGDHHGPQSR
jgi:hypothetical protein